MHLRLSGSWRLALWRCVNVDSRSMFLDLLGNRSLVRTPAFSSRTKAFWIVSYSSATQSTLLKMVTLIMAVRVFQENPSKIDWSLEEN